MPRGTTLAGQLAAMGFGDTSRAQRLITGDLGLDITARTPACSRRSPPRPTRTWPWPAWPGCRPTPGCGWPCAMTRASGPRLINVLGVSTALGGHLERHPGDWRILRGPDALRRPTTVRAA